jgi:hypothetical protein
MRTIQFSRRAILPVDRLLADLLLPVETQTLRPAIDNRCLAMSGMQDDKKLPDDLGTAHEVILVQSNTLVPQKVKIEEIDYTRTKKSKPRKVAQDTFPAHLPRESDPPGKRAAACADEPTL